MPIETPSHSNHSISLLLVADSLNVGGAERHVVSLASAIAQQGYRVTLVANQLGLGETVHFLGARTDIPVLNRLLDVFVLPSRDEVCPMALLEAMATARAVVATQVGGTPEVVTRAVDGWLVPPEDPSALARALLMMLEDSALRAALDAATRSKVITQFTRERMVDEMLSFFQRILAKSS
jgi:glycosyltransferase involved in cell wall biosynthesis